MAKGGLVVYGAFFGGVAGLLLFVRKHRLPLLALCDLIAPSMVLGLAIGRIGCLMNGCCFGAVCDYPGRSRFRPARRPIHPPYRAQVERGQMYGFTLSGNPKAEPRVLAVRPDSPADRAGLKPGDRLQSINGDEAVGHRRRLFGVGRGLRPAAAAAHRGGEPAGDHGAGDRASRAQPAGASDADLQRDRRAGVVPAAVGLRPIPPPRRRSVRADDVDLSGHAFLHRKLCGATRRPVFGTGMSISQNVSLLLFVCAAALWFYILRRPPQRAKEADSSKRKPRPSVV